MSDDQPTCDPAVPELVALAARTRPDLDRDAVCGLIIGALTYGMPWPWVMRTVVWSLADPEHTLHDVRTALYARQPGRTPRTI